MLICNKKDSCNGHRSCNHRILHQEKDSCQIEIETCGGNKKVKCVTTEGNTINFFKDGKVVHKIKTEDKC